MPPAPSNGRHRAASRPGRRAGGTGRHRAPAAPVASWARGVRVGGALGAAVVVGLPLTATGAHAAGAPGRTGSCATVGSGAAGPAVAALQAAVGATPDGDYGPLTAGAVRAWQVRHHLAPSGAVDPATWAALPSSVDAAGCGAAVRLPAGAPGGCATVARGDRGAAVAALQRALGVSADGIFGPHTAAALLDSQRRHHVPATGLTDPQTWSAVGLAGTPACGAPAGPAPAGPAPGRPAPGGPAPGGPAPRGPSPRQPAPPRPPAPAPDPGKAAARRAIAQRVAGEVAALARTPDRAAPARGAAAVAFARAQLGVPYVYGGTDRRGYDCSGLVGASYRSTGLLLQRTAAAQYTEGRPVPLSDLRPGDVVFYAGDLLDPGTTYHDAIYVGGGRMIEAAHPGTTVREVALRPWDLLPTAARPSALLGLPAVAGSTGFTTRQVQVRLVMHGQPVLIDGDFGPRTAAAVRAVQRAAGLPATGVVDSRTWALLTR